MYVYIYIYIYIYRHVLRSRASRPRAREALANFRSQHSCALWRLAGGSYFFRFSFVFCSFLFMISIYFFSSSLFNMFFLVLFSFYVFFILFLLFLFNIISLLVFRLFSMFFMSFFNTCFLFKTTCLFSLVIFGPLAVYYYYYL